MYAITGTLVPAAAATALIITTGSLFLSPIDRQKRKSRHSYSTPRPLEIAGSQRRYREEKLRARGSFVAVVVPRSFAHVLAPGIRGERGRRGPPHSWKFFDVYGNEKEVKNRRISTRPSGARTRRTEREPEVIRKRGSRGGSMHFSRFISTGFSHPHGAREQPVDRPDEPRN